MLRSQLQVCLSFNLSYFLNLKMLCYFFLNFCSFTTVNMLICLSREILKISLRVSAVLGSIMFLISSLKISGISFLKKFTFPSSFSSYLLKLQQNMCCTLILYSLCCLPLFLHFYLFVCIVYSKQQLLTYFLGHSFPSAIPVLLQYNLTEIISLIYMFIYIF